MSRRSEYSANAGLALALAPRVDDDAQREARAAELRVASVRSMQAARARIAARRAFAIRYAAAWVVITAASIAAYLVFAGGVV